MEEELRPIVTNSVEASQEKVEMSPGLKILDIFQNAYNEYISAREKEGKQYNPWNQSDVIDFILFNKQLQLSEKLRPILAANPIKGIDDKVLRFQYDDYLCEGLYEVSLAKALVRIATNKGLVDSKEETDMLEQLLQPSADDLSTVIIGHDEKCTQLLEEARAYFNGVPDERLENLAYLVRVGTLLAKRRNTATHTYDVFSDEEVFKLSCELKGRSKNEILGIMNEYASILDGIAKESPSSMFPTLLREKIKSYGNLVGTRETNKELSGSDLTHGTKYERALFFEE